MRPIWLIARTVLLEAVRRKEIYAIVLVSLLLLGAVMTVDFFGIKGLTKFYREVALKLMGTATAFTVVILASRQLPREFESRTIHPMLARPISRATFLLGKLLGVLLAAGFCFGLFMAVFLAGSFYLESTAPGILFVQYVYLQFCMLLVISTLSFWLSLVLNLDAAITLASIFYLTAVVFTSAALFLYPFSDGVGKAVIKASTWLIPQLTLFDLSEKTVHAENWEPLSVATLAQLTAYSVAYSSVYFLAAWYCFRRRRL